MGVTGEAGAGGRGLPAAPKAQTRGDAPERGSAVAHAGQEAEQRAAEPGGHAPARDLARDPRVADLPAAEQALLGGIGGELRAERDVRDRAVARTAAVGDRVGRPDEAVEAARVAADVRRVRA